MRSATKRMLKAAWDKQFFPSRYKLHYKCCIKHVHPEIAGKFTQMDVDSHTASFIEWSKRRSGNICLQLFYNLVRFFLMFFLSPTSINGILGRGQMFIFSREQLQRIVPPLSSAPSPLLIDIGAGDGNVTDVLKSVFSPSVVCVTETSGVMKRVLARKGYRVLDVETWDTCGHLYDIISCLNVLDRCDKPLSLLRSIYNSLAPGGYVLLAVVLPFDPFVEKGPLQTAPTESLPMDGGTWEADVSSLWIEVLKPMGFTLQAVTRLPYICEGDLDVDHYALDDAIFVLSKT